MDLLGIHHLTAISADIRGNHRFYTQVLGLRLVKRSVNQDDVSAYHLFYADAKGTPGTDITFFDWPMPPERRGTHSIVRTCMRVRGSSLQWWEGWLREQDVNNVVAQELGGRNALLFEDPEGQRLALVEDDGKGPDAQTWNRSPVPSEHQIRGLGPIMMSVPVITQTEMVLTQVMNMRRRHDYAHPDNPRNQVHVFEMAEGGAHAELHVIAQPDLPVTRQGAGAVHHVAFRTPTEDEYHAWTDRLNTVGIPNSGEIDRFWFHSLYFREPNGVLFEIATDGPGFSVDEDPNTLGEKVVLPPFLEAHRQQIVGALKPID
jgi:glyoxalase family protein